MASAASTASASAQLDNSARRITSVVEGARQHSERVLTARLRDARFFWDEDRKETLESRIDRPPGRQKRAT